MDIYPKIYATVNKIPEGNIASYSQVGRALGLSNGARLVGWAMRSLPPGSTVPWWRVVNMKRQISIVNPHVTKTEQQRRLEAEGRIIEERNGWLTVQGTDWATLA